MLCTCEACKYIFSTDQFDTKCPDCGKNAVRLSTAEETAQHERDMQVDGQTTLFNESE